MSAEHKNLLEISTNWFYPTKFVILKGEVAFGPYDEMHTKILNVLATQKEYDEKHFPIVDFGGFIYRKDGIPYIDTRITTSTTVRKLHAAGIDLSERDWDENSENWNLAKNIRNQAAQIIASVMNESVIVEHGWDPSTNASVTETVHPSSL